MKIAFFLIFAGLGVLWFADETIQDYGLMFFNGSKWKGTGFTGWSIFEGLWVIWGTVSVAVALLLAGIVAWLKFDFQSREKELKEELVIEKQEAIAEIEKIHASQIQNLLASQTNNSRHLENAYADVAKYKRMLANQEDENALLINKIKGKDAVIMRLDRKIKKLSRLETPRF